MAGPVNRKGFTSSFERITPVREPDPTASITDVPPGATSPSYEATLTFYSPISPEQHKEVMRVHSPETLELFYMHTQGKTPEGMRRLIGETAAELGGLRHELIKLEERQQEASSAAPITVAKIKKQAAAQERKQQILRDIRLKTFMLQGAAVEQSELFGEAPVESLTYAEVEIAIRRACEEEGIAEENNGYISFFSEPGFSSERLENLELLASIHEEITKIAKDLETNPQKKGNAQRQIDLVRKSDQLVQNAADAIARRDDLGDRDNDLVSTIRRDKSVSALKEKYRRQGWSDYARVMGFSTIAAVVGASLHYGFPRTGVEEWCKTWKDFDENNPRHILRMAFLSGITLGGSYFVVNRTFQPMFKLLLEQLGGRRLQKTSAQQVIPTAVHSLESIEKNDLNNADFNAANALAAKEKRSFENRARLYQEGGLIGDIFGHGSFGFAQFFVAFLGYAGLIPRVTGTLVGTACEALSDIHFKFMQTFDDGANRGKDGIPTYTVAAGDSWHEGWKRAKKRMQDVNVFASREAVRVLLHHLLAGVAATVISNTFKYLGRDAESAIAKSLIAFLAAVSVVSPLYAATEFKPAAGSEEDPFLHTKTAFEGIRAPFTPPHFLVPHATREPDTPEGSRLLRSIDDVHKCTQGLQAIVPYAIADVLVLLGGLVWDTIEAMPPVQNKLRKT